MSFIFATANDMQMYHVCDLGKISESVREKSKRHIYKMAATSIVLTRGSFYASRKILEIFPGACPVTNRRLNICCFFIGINMHFGFENLKNTIYFIEQWGLEYKC